jgi:hypothetical protein
VGKQCRLRDDGLEAPQAITLAGPVDVGGLTLLRCIGKDLIKIDPGADVDAAANVLNATPEPMTMLMAMAIENCFVTMTPTPGDLSPRYEGKVDRRRPVALLYEGATLCLDMPRLIPKV